MLTTTLNTGNTWGIAQKTNWATYISSPLFLHLALNSGWKIVKSELVPSHDQLGLVYLLTLESGPCQRQEVILPRSALLKRILEAHPNDTIAAEKSQPIGEQFPTI